MTKTLPPDTKVQSETLEEIAERITNDWLNDGLTGGGDLCDAILSALLNEREACAKVLESKELSDPSMFGPAYKNGWNDAVRRIAKAIREGR